MSSRPLTRDSTTTSVSAPSANTSTVVSPRPTSPSSPSSSSPNDENIDVTSPRLSKKLSLSAISPHVIIARNLTFTDFYQVLLPAVSQSDTLRLLSKDNIIKYILLICW